jgi:hypothetical protein
MIAFDNSPRPNITSRFWRGMAASRSPVYPSTFNVISIAPMSFLISASLSQIYSASSKRSTRLVNKPDIVCSNVSVLAGFMSFRIGSSGSFHNQIVCAFAT